MIAARTRAGRSQVSPVVVITSSRRGGHQEHQVGDRVSGARALEDPHVLPVGHLELGRVVLVEVEDLELGELARGAAGPRRLLPVLLPDEALQEGVVVGRVVAGRAAALAVARVEALRLDYEVEALEVLEGHGHAVPAALFRLAAALGATAPVQGHERAQGALRAAGPGPRGR